MKSIYKIRLIVEIVLFFLTIAIYLIIGPKLIVLIPYGLFITVKYSVKKYYTYLRDNTNLRTSEGQSKIKKYNRVINILNGYYND